MWGAACPPDPARSRILRRGARRSSSKPGGRFGTRGIGQFRSEREPRLRCGNARFTDVPCRRPRHARGAFGAWSPSSRNARVGVGRGETSGRSCSTPRPAYLARPGCLTPPVRNGSASTRSTNSRRTRFPGRDSLLAVPREHPTARSPVASAPAWPHVQPRRPSHP
jgi:hypothetical protein